MNHSLTKVVCGFMCGYFLLCAAPSWSQTALPLSDLSSFKQAAKTWRIAGDVQADLAAANTLKTASGSGVLVNLPTDKEKGQDLFTNLVHGDADVEFEYLMAKGANSGVYLQGRYEIQLLDSWGKQKPYSGDNGGIYERWDDSKPDGHKGYEGHAPRQNVSKAPGLWQKMRISFQAPRFDASGKKVENARILSIQLNGVTIHENVELSGPTRGAMEANEVLQGPIRIQGDHGAVAFRNIKVIPFGKQKPVLKDLQYSVYQGQFDAPADVVKAKATASGKLLQLSAAITTLANDFLIAYTGKLEVKEQGDYSFRLGVPGGKGYLKIAGKELLPFSERSGAGNISLSPGEYPVEILYAKTANWAKPNIQLSVGGAGLRESLLSDPTAVMGNLVDPILVDAPRNAMVRSFVDLPVGGRVTHAISIGSAEGLHYTYDLDNGTIVQAWRGSFLDATPMWHERGDGSARPMGMVQYFGKSMPAMAVLNQASDAWKADSVGTGFRPRGYAIDKEDRPTFMYQIFGAQVQDAPRVSADGKELQRTILVAGAPANFYLRIAEGKDIKEQAKGLYVVGDKELFIRIDDAGGATPLVRNGTGGNTELLLPITNKAVYSILF